MNVLVMSLPTGGGHHSTGMAIVERIKTLGHNAEMVDVYEYISPTLGNSVSKGYIMSTKYAPEIYGFEYNRSEVKGATRKVQVSRTFNFLVAMAFLSYIKDFNPDVIVCTHVMAAQMITSLRKRDKLDPKIKVVGIITDFTIHPFWELVNVDYFITASELLNNQIEKRGMDLSKVRPLGIPIEEKFANKISKSEARKILGIEDKKTILIMSGSMGYGSIFKHIKQLDSLEDDFQMIIVCGKNKKMFRRAKAFETRKTKYVYGFTKDVHIMMDASECIITKPGGLTVSESLAKGLPLILFNPIPGQEDRNLEFLLNNGVAQSVTDTYPVDDAIYQLLNNKPRLDSLENCIRQIGKPNATKDLCDFILGL